MHHAIQAERLVKTYGKVRALDGLSFEVPTGTIFGLLGPNGAGKSTAVRILTTLSRPDDGTATVAGLDVMRSQDQVRLAIGCVTQKISVDPATTGRENLVLHGALYGLPRRDLRRRTDELLARFGLAEAADRPARTYSGGMQRKLDVAMGLIHRPRVLFLDEPTTGLDPEARAALWAEIAGLAADEGLTILLTTHYLEEADRLAATLAIVDRGRVVAAGSPDALKNELRGDAIVADLAGTESLAEAERALGRVPGAREVTVSGRRLRARVDDGAAAVPLVLAALDAAGVRVGAITVARPSLDDVYLRHTGRTFEEEAA
ncbi:ATP-binding cassette domain-containing protein [Planomonospora venezuelensis]|uniref:ABC-2 type transport system ATP-binding protein n=1 Tax=Planomonospora venezuelensis TaxID=1999 RepID=A0A841CZ30_PLAVE|nr:ATP-binding cassette domain-containing protein [Planomonospora venezuelensis]MBB5962549.1 ABC-2 type transport system ATP-binding protein [Planomonospora venezuelensis]GIM99045.1 daunorubicin resistance protein DrrA family ABC transporter ATP-binding protein [Planomonospora venezuelensis]